MKYCKSPISRFFIKNAPAISTSIGIAGMFTASILAVKNTPKACAIINNMKKENEEELTKMEIVKATWKCYAIPTAIGLASAGCIIGGMAANVKRSAALATAYSLTEAALREYKSKTLETVGHDVEKQIRESISKERLKKAESASPIQKEIIMSDDGSTICFDSWTGRYFKSDVDKINKAINVLNKQMIEDEFVSLNDYYYELGLSNVRPGDDMGWNIRNGFIELEFTADIFDGGKPCLIVSFINEPKYEY